MSESLAATEALGARGATHPRVTLQEIEAAIADEFYATGHEMAVSAGYVEPDRVLPEPLKIFTICLLVMKNGFVQLGYSAPASPENFDAEKGRQFARENAIRDLWPKMGFSLRDRLHEAAGTE